jgi:acetyl-CoA carboxylase biotin carboxyl carrier protein
MKIDEIKEIMKEMNINGIDYFQYEGEGINLKLKKNSCANVFDIKRGIDEANENLEENVKASKVISYSDYIKSPIVGTFYSKPSPDKDSFVKIGDTVKKGTVLCIVEAMKVMNEIIAEQDIKILDVLVSDEDVVEYGQKLFGIEKL